MPHTLTRRKLLTLLGLSAPTLAATLSQLRAQSAKAQPGILDVAVVGAGSAGLTAGFLLNKAGASFRVLEAANIHGGRARKDTSLADFPLDLGGEWVHTTNRVLNTLSGTS
ncbi:MAG: NAD(P)-binding protein, partial [Pseudomonadota bacterium]